MEGASIASRWPLQGVQKVDLDVTSRTADFPCLALIVEIVAHTPAGLCCSSIIPELESI